MLNSLLYRHHRDAGEQIMDRFIPRSLSSQAYHSAHDHLATLLHPLVDDSLLNMNFTSRSEGARALFASPTSRNTPPPTAHSTASYTSSSADFHLGAMRNALDFPQGRVLNFSPSTTNPAATTPRNHRAPRSSTSTPGTATSTTHSPLAHLPSGGAALAAGSNSSLIFSYVRPEEALTPSSGSSSRRVSLDSISDISTMSTPRPKLKKRRARSHDLYRVLDAPMLRNDFYTNLVTWSTYSNKIAVGLNDKVFLWSEEDGALVLDLPDDDVVSVVSFSEGDFLVVGTKSGKLSLYSQELELCLHHIQATDIGVGLCCATWVPGDDRSLFVGSEDGVVSMIMINQFEEVELLNSFQCHEQQVCGIAVSHDASQVAVGGNDNCCTVWDVSDIMLPKMKYFLPHNAAVKAVAYCPWSKSLLATGGGSRDRTIKFWHTNSGTLLDTIETQGQVTSLIWSKKKREIVATFGFGDRDDPTLVAVYSYPRMEKLIHVEATEDLRVLSGVLSPDSSTICCATTDDTVRLYELWDTSDCIIRESLENGVFGSELLELQEGITRGGGLIR